MTAACYKPSLTAEYTEDSQWAPFDFLSRLVKEWEAAGLLPESMAKTTKQVVVRPGTWEIIFRDTCLFVSVISHICLQGEKGKITLILK